MKRINYTQRTLAKLKSMGAVYDVCEKWVMNPRHPAGGFRRDLFGMFDIVALLAGEKPPTRIVGIQSTSLACAAAHRKTILESPFLGPWMAAGGRVELWLWSQPGGARKPWKLTVEQIQLQ